MKKGAPGPLRVKTLFLKIYNNLEKDSCQTGAHDMFHARSPHQETVGDDGVTTLVLKFEEGKNS